MGQSNINPFRFRRSAMRMAIKRYGVNQSDLSELSGSIAVITKKGSAITPAQISHCLGSTDYEPSVRERDMLLDGWETLELAFAAWAVEKNRVEIWDFYQQAVSRQMVETLGSLFPGKESDRLSKTMNPGIMSINQTVARQAVLA